MKILYTVIVLVACFIGFIFGANYGHDNCDKLWREWLTKRGNHRTITKEEELKLYHALVDGIYSALDKMTNK